MTGRDEMFPSRAHFRLSRAVGGQTPCLAISLHSFPKRASTCPNNSPFPFSLLSYLRSFLPTNTALRAFFRTLFFASSTDLFLHNPSFTVRWSSFQLYLSHLLIPTAPLRSQ